MRGYSRFGGLRDDLHEGRKEEAVTTAEAGHTSTYLRNGEKGLILMGPTSFSLGGRTKRP